MIVRFITRRLRSCTEHVPQIVSAVGVLSMLAILCLGIFTLLGAPAFSGQATREISGSGGDPVSLEPIDMSAYDAFAEQIAGKMLTLWESTTDDRSPQGEAWAPARSWIVTTPKGKFLISCGITSVAVGANHLDAYQVTIARVSE